MSKKPKVDMSTEAVTARIKFACRPGEAELLATLMIAARAEIFVGKTNPGKYPEWKRSR